MAQLRCLSLLLARHAATLALCVVLLLVVASPALAQSPWETSTQKLQQAFTGPIAKALLELLDEDMRKVDRLIDVPY